MLKSDELVARSQLPTREPYEIRSSSERISAPRRSVATAFLSRGRLQRHLGAEPRALPSSAAPTPPDRPA
jgi:hypothetical protein